MVGSDLINLRSELVEFLAIAQHAFDDHVHLVLIRLSDQFSVLPCLGVSLCVFGLRRFELPL